MGSMSSKLTSKSRRTRVTDPLPLPTAPTRRQRGLNLLRAPLERALNRPIRRECGLNQLPNELLLEIAKYLGEASDMIAFMLVNKHLAIILGHLPLLRFYQGSAGRRALFGSERPDPDSFVLRLLSTGVDLNATFCDCAGLHLIWCRCMPALHSAIVYSNITMVDSLLRHGARIDAPYGQKGDNAVHLAIENADLQGGHFRIIAEIDLAILDLLLDEGRLQTMNDPASLNNNGETWLSTAVQNCGPRQITIVEPFLSAGVSVDVPGLVENWTPLHIAVLNNRVDLVGLLLSHGADHRTTDSNGITPFATACNRPNCELINLLLRHDATLIDSVVDDRGGTAEVCLEREIERLSLREDPETDYYRREMGERQELLPKLIKLAKKRRNSEISDDDLQSYYNSLEDVYLDDFYLEDLYLEDHY